MLRLKGTSRGLALTTDGKARFCALDPHAGARLVVIEAARNLACVGAVPKALVNCLNFGNPEHPEVMWEFSEVVDGMADACRALGIPVVGGNVSFYNESRGRDIDPTPVVGVVGLIDDLATVPPASELHDGDAIVLLGHTEAELGGSEWATSHDLRGGLPPSADLDVAAALHDFVRDIVVRARRSRGVHDVSDGGLAVALAEMAVAGGCGFDVALASELVPALAWFSESTSRVVVAVDPTTADALVDRARAASVPAQRLGTAGGDRLVAAGRQGGVLRRPRRRHPRLARRPPQCPPPRANISKLTSVGDGQVRDVRGGKRNSGAGVGVDDPVYGTMTAWTWP